MSYHFEIVAKRQRIVDTVQNANGIPQPIRGLIVEQVNKFEADDLIEVIAFGHVAGTNAEKAGHDIKMRKLTISD